MVDEENTARGTSLENNDLENTMDKSHDYDTNDIEGDEIYEFK